MSTAGTVNQLVEQYAEYLKICYGNIQFEWEGISERNKELWRKQAIILLSLNPNLELKIIVKDHDGGYGEKYIPLAPYLKDARK